MSNRITLIIAALLAAISATPQGAKPGPAVQMPGDNGKVGVPYSLGAKGQELVFTLEKAEFAPRAFTSDNAMFASDKQRLLVVTFAVQNPGKVDRFFNGPSFLYTVVSPDDKNYVGGANVYHPETLEAMNVSLKPAQKVRAVFAIAIHPKGVVNKLIVQRGSGTPVLRYDLRDKVKPMAGAFAAVGGVDMLEVGKAKVGTPFGNGCFDYNIEKVEESATAVDALKPGAGKKLVIVTATVSNVAKIDATFASNFVVPTLADDNGEPARVLAVSKMSSTELLPWGKVQPGKQLRFRMIFEAAAAVKPTVLTIMDVGSGRSVDVQLLVTSR